VGAMYEQPHFPCYFLKGVELGYFAYSGLFHSNSCILIFRQLQIEHIKASARRNQPSDIWQLTTPLRT
jgi:hypothetical protein